MTRHLGRGDIGRGDIGRGDIGRGDIDGINHAGLIAEDLDAACAGYERLGFTFAPLSMHRGSWTPGGEVVAFGTGNRCAIFERNYLEISAHVDRGKDGRGIDRFLARFPGLHIVCFDCGDAAVVARRLRAQGVPTSGVIPLQREVDTPEGRRLARFDCVHVADSLTPEGRIQAAHHRNPEYVQQPRYMTHENGALALTETVLCVERLEEWGERYSQILDCEPEVSAHARTFRLPHARFVILDEAGLAQCLPGQVAPTLPALVAFTVAAADLDATRSLLARRGVPTVELSTANRLFVPAAHACGTAVVFEAITPQGTN